MMAKERHCTEKDFVLVDISFHGISSLSTCSRQAIAERKACNDAFALPQTSSIFTQKELRKSRVYNDKQCDAMRCDGSAMRCAVTHLEHVRDGQGMSPLQVMHMPPKATAQSRTRAGPDQTSCAQPSVARGPSPAGPKGGTKPPQFRCHRYRHRRRLHPRGHGCWACQ